MEKLKSVCFNENNKNMAVAAISMSLCIMSSLPAGVIQNIALAESTDLDLVSGYYAESFKVAFSIIAAVFFNPIYNLIGIKLTALISTLLVTGTYWVMIWIVSKQMLYFGAALTGLGLGALWILWPMVIIDNSTPETKQRNMGLWFMTVALGLVIGGLANYFYFQDVRQISKENRIVVYVSCSVVTILAAILSTVAITDVKKNSQRDVMIDDVEAVSGHSDEEGESEADVMIMMPGKPSPGQKVKDCFHLLVFKAGFRESFDWFKIMMRMPEFWLLALPLFAWGFLWGFMVKILPTAIPSISDNRGLIPLISVIMGVCYLFGTTIWNFIRKFTGNGFVVVTCCLFVIAAAVLAILILPQGSSTEILVIGSVKTYVHPDSIYIALICAFIGMGDSGLSIIYYTTAGRIYGAGTGPGYAMNGIGYHGFYFLSMFAANLVSLHVYCYILIAGVVATALAFLLGLKNYMSE